MAICSCSSCIILLYHNIILEKWETNVKSKHNFRFIARCAHTHKQTFWSLSSVFGLSCSDCGSFLISFSLSFKGLKNFFYSQLKTWWSHALELDKKRFLGFASASWSHSNRIPSNSIHTHTHFSLITKTFEATIEEERTKIKTGKL